MPARAAANLQAFVARIDAMREATRGLTLREIIDHMLEASGLVDFYKTDREGKDRLENLEELVNAAEAFVTQEGFGKDAVALPVDEAGASGLGRYRGEAGKAEFNTPGAEVVTSGEIVAPPRIVPDAETGEIMSPLAAFLTHASLEAGDNQAQAGAGRGPADDDPLGQGARVRLRLHHRPRGGPVPARELVPATSTASRRSGA